MRTTIYVVGDRDDLVTVWDVVRARLAPHRPPPNRSGPDCEEGGTLDLVLQVSQEVEPDIDAVATR